MVAQNTELARTQNTIAPIWGDRSETRELVARFRAGLPNAKDIPDVGLIALATAALAHNLDPWNGEIWCIYNKEKGETSLMAGIKGLRKAAKRQMTDRFFYDVNFRDVPPEEWHLYATEKDEKGRAVERVSICTLRRQDATKNYLDQLGYAKEICGDVDTARSMVGEPPRWIGVGIVRVGEKSRMERTRLARKRAEGEATTQAFDLPFVNQDYNGNTVTVGVSEDAVDADTPSAPQEDQGQPMQLPEDVKRPYTPSVVLARIQERIAHNPTANEAPASQKQQNYVASLLNKAFAESATADKDRHAVQMWLTGKASVKDMTAAEAKALIDWLVDETDDLGQDAYKEAQVILREAMLAEGQIDMFGSGEGGSVEE